MFIDNSELVSTPFHLLTLVSGPVCFHRAPTALYSTVKDFKLRLQRKGAHRSQSSVCKRKTPQKKVSAPGGSAQSLETCWLNLDCCKSVSGFTVYTNLL